MRSGLRNLKPPSAMMARFCPAMDNLLPPRRLCDDAGGPDKKMSDIGHCLAERLPRFPGQAASSAGGAAVRRRAGTDRARGESR
jgi:hypothetical protein